MSPSKPLSYGPLKSVFANIDAVKRFEIFQKMPTIQKTEKLVPLKIDKFAFGYRAFTMNETTYDVKSIIKRRKTSGNKFCSQEYIRLAINGIAIEYLEYHPAQVQRSSEYMMSLFFGGRSDPILINQLTFDASQSLTWLENAKLRIQQLTIRSSIRRAMKALSSVLTESSFPLQSLKIFVDPSTEEEFRDEVVQQARKVIVQTSNSYFTMGAENWNFLPANTHFEGTNKLAPDHFVALIRHWKVLETAPGRRCSVGLSNNIDDEMFGKLAMRSIQVQFDVVKEDGVITIPINQSSEVRVSVNHDGPQDSNNKPTSILVLEVVAKM